MTFQEKLTWVNSLVAVVVASWYAWVVAGRLGQVAVEEVAYQRPLLFAVGAMIVLTIVGAILMAIGSAIGSAVGGAIKAEISGAGTVEEIDIDVDRSDERDAAFEARGDRVAYYVSSVFMVGVLALAMLERPHFWIANAVFATFVVATLVGNVAKLAAYRRGF